MALDLTRLEAEIARDASVNASAAQLIERLATEIENSKDDPEALQALVDRMREQSDTLAAAVSANTPAEEPASVTRNTHGGPERVPGVSQADRDAAAEKSDAEKRRAESGQ